MSGDADRLEREAIRAKKKTIQEELLEQINRKKTL
jgi:hypothetical protein